MEPVTLQAVLRETVGKEREGRFVVPDKKSMSVHLSRETGGLTLQRVVALFVGETYVRLETHKGETIYVSFEDVRAIVVEEKEKKAGFGT
jgi:hypothetical protein